ncbi:MAG: P-loop NTPase fold protein [Thainema sp.]
MDKFIDFISHLFIGRIIRSNIFTAVMQNEEQSVNSHVEEYLDYYCNLEHSPEFAVLLKGDWGSGKTHFIKQYIKKLERKRQKSLYVSLYGMASFSDIEFAFFQQLYPPFLTSKKAILVGKLFGNFIKGMFKVDLNSDGKDDVSITLQGSNINLINSLADVGKNILIFDDLER